MKSGTRKIKGTTVVDVTGHIDIGTSPALRTTMLECMKSSERVAINLSAVKYIDSSGIASLLEVLKEATNTKRKFVLFGLSPAVREVIQLTRLGGVFDIYESEEEVLSAGTQSAGR